MTGGGFPWLTLILVAGSLVLVWRSAVSHRMPFEKRAAMAAAWVLIIVIVAFVASRLGG